MSARSFKASSRGRARPSQERPVSLPLCWTTLALPVMRWAWAPFCSCAECCSFSIAYRADAARGPPCGTDPLTHGLLPRPLQNLGVSAYGADAVKLDSWSDPFGNVSAKVGGRHGHQAKTRYA